MNIIIFGSTGAGKGTQSKLISEKYNLLHISTGEVLREEISKGTEIGKIADDLLSRGCLVPDEIIIEMIKNLICSKKENNGFIFDGFPRTIPQAEFLNEIFENCNIELNAVINLEVDDTILIKRVLMRSMLEQRDYDSKEIIENRLKIYHEQTAPLIDFYTNNNILYSVDGSKEVKTVFEDICSIINNL